MAQYDELKGRLLLATASLVAMGTGVAYLLAGLPLAVPFVVGGGLGVAYQLMLQQGVDALPLDTTTDAVQVRCRAFCACCFFCVCVFCVWARHMRGCNALLWLSWLPHAFACLLRVAHPIGNPPPLRVVANPTHTSPSRVAAPCQVAQCAWSPC